MRGLLSPPSVPHEVVRARVLRLLDQRWEHMVTTVTAGPGFGKSIAVGQAVRANQALPRGVEAWLSCRSGLEDPRRLVDAVRRAFGAGGAVAAGAAGAVGAAGAGSLLAQLQQVVAELAPVDAALILDDVEQLAASPGCVDLLDQLLRDLPWNLHVVLCGRRLPPVALARLRAADQVVDVVDDDLRFDDAEIAALASAAGGSVPARDLGGWPALVRLAVAAPRSGASVSDFLWDEVIRGLDLADRRALSALCLLGPSTAEDLAAVCSAPFDAVRFCERVPLVHEAEGRLVAHGLWTPFVDQLVPASEQAALGRRAMALTTARGDAVASGTLAIRLGDGAALRAAAVALVRETLTNLPVDLAAAWVAAADPPPEPEEPDPPDTPAPPEPEIELLDCALAHARDPSQPPAGRLAALAAAFRARGDAEAEGIVLALTAIRMDATGDVTGLPALAVRAEELAVDHDDPLLWELVEGVRAMLTAATGDLAGALALLERRRGSGRRALRTETVDRLHWRLLLLAGRAGDAARLALDEEMAAAARWLDGDPSGFDLDQVDLSAERYAGVGERERFDRANFVAMLAVATGDPGPVDVAVEILTSSPLARTAPLYAARVAAAIAAQQVVHHDDAGAATTIAEFLAAQPDLDPISDAFLRRSLAVPYVCSPDLRRRWDTASLGPAHQQACSIARLLVALRGIGAASSTETVAAATDVAARRRGPRRMPEPALPSLATGPEPVGAVCTVLPLPWSVELAVRAAQRGLSWGAALAEDLADRFGPSVRDELVRLETSATAVLREGAATLRRALPAAPAKDVRIGVLGPLEIAQGGEPADAPALRRGRVRELLSILVVERSLTRERVLDVLWPDLDESKARANLRVTLTHLQRLLEPDREAGRPPYFLRTDTERLRLADVPELAVDLWDAERLLRDADTARRNGDAAARMRHLDAAVAGWRGRPLPDLDGLPALAATGAYVTTRLTDACLTLGELELTRGGVSRVIECAERALAADAYLERAHRLAVAAALQARDRSALRTARERLAAMLDDVGADPEETTQMLLRQAAAWDAGVSGQS